MLAITITGRLRVVIPAAKETSVAGKATERPEEVTSSLVIISAAIIAEGMAVGTSKAGRAG